MKIDPANILLNRDIKIDIRFFFVSGNEITLMEKILSNIVRRYKINEKAEIINIETLENFVDEQSLFTNKKIYLGRSCKGITQNNLNKLQDTNNVFVFIQENSQKIKKVKGLFANDKNSYLIDCYELNQDVKIKILNEFLSAKKLKIDKDLFWFLIEKLDNRYAFLEDSLNKISELDNNDINLNNIIKLLTFSDSSKERIFFYLLKKNQEIVGVYREKILTSADVNSFYYYCRFFCQLIIDCENEEEYKKKIPAYLFRDKNFLVQIYKKYDFKKKKLLLNLLSATEKILRKESDLSLVFGLRFMLNIKKITIS